MILFNEPLVTGSEIININQVFTNNKYCGDGNFTQKVNMWLEKKMQVKKALLTTSCTHALEMAAILIDIKPGDEVIMPSYTFVSTANAFVLRGAKIIFVDIRPDTMNIDELKIEKAISKKTKAIVPVHYAGVACEMDTIMDIAHKYNIYVIEDAAQAMLSTYKGKSLGSIGHMGCFSYHETKNYQCGEGGALLINDSSFIERAEIIREKGTNRSSFLRGVVDKYTWVDLGSSYLPSELNAAFLYAQLEVAEHVNTARLKLWNRYYKNLLKISDKIVLPQISSESIHNAHMFYIKVDDIDQRQTLIDYLKEYGIASVFHYIPLHSSDAGRKFGSFIGSDIYTSKESKRLLRLPMHANLDIVDIDLISNKVIDFFDEA